MNEDGYALELQGIEKSFQNGMEKLDIFRDVNLSLKFNEAVALIGPSGAGKSTLLQIAGLLTKPSGGTVRIATHDATLARPHKRTKLRRKNIGFIYQFHHLLAEFTALENVMMPLLINGITNVKAKQRAGALLTDVGLGARAMHRPSELSGGERQRVAIARAIVAEPALILADEPTGNLDPKNAENIFAMILSLVKKRNIALLMVTHNYDLAKVMDAVYELDNGVIISH